MLAAAVSGCGGEDGPEIAGVHGKITMDGKPLANATVVFIPESGRPGGARTDEDGEYVLNFSGGRQGAMLGKNTIRISTLSDPSENEDGTTTPGSPETVPMKYNAMSELTFVVEQGDNEANFDISSEGPLPDSELDADEAGIVEEQ